MYGRTLSPLLAVVSTLILAASPSAAQGRLWRDEIQVRNPAAERLRAGEALETAFDRAFRSCGFQRFVERRFPQNRRLTRIPQVLQDNITLEDSVRQLRSTSLARALSYVAPAGSDPALVQVPLERRHLRLDPRISPDVMIPQGDPRLVFTYSCGSTAKLAAELNLNVTPVASAAFNAMRTSSSDVSVAVTEGPFVSPLTTMLDDAGTKGFYARHLVWDWYARNPDAIVSGGTYRSQVNGIVTSRLYTDRLDQSLKASAEGNSGPLAFASLSASAQGSLVLNQGSTVERYGIWEYLKTAGDTNSLARLPTPADLNREMTQRMHADLIRTSEDVVQSLPYTHAFRVDGFHPDYCNDGAWQVGGTYASSLTRRIQPETPSTTGNQPWIRCLVEITFTSPESLWREPHPVDFTLAYTLVSRISSGRDTARLTLPFNVPVHLVGHPDLRLIRPAAQWTRFEPNTTSPLNVIWTGYEVLVSDTRNRVDWVNFDPGGFRAQLRCPAIGNAATSETTAVSLIGTPRRDPSGNVKFDFQAAFPTGATTNLATSRECTFEGTIEFMLQNSARVVKRLPSFTISYPGA